MAQAEHQRRKLLLRAKLDGLLDLAVRQAGGQLTTHEAKEYFVRSGRSATAHRLHLMLCGLADPQAVARRTRQPQINQQLLRLETTS